MTVFKWTSVYSQTQQREYEDKALLCGFRGRHDLVVLYHDVHDGHAFLDTHHCNIGVRRIWMVVCRTARRAPVPAYGPGPCECPRYLGSLRMMFVSRPPSAQLKVDLFLPTK